MSLQLNLAWSEESLTFLYLRKSFGGLHNEIVELTAKHDTLTLFLVYEKGPIKIFINFPSLLEVPLSFNFDKTIEVFYS